MNLMPHDHLVWANIGIYTGCEDNIFWRETDASIAAFYAEALFQKDNTTRSQWNPETLEEEPSEVTILDVKPGQGQHDLQHCASITF
jgi:predicted metal-dependent enzyme (double-stranded beta helix superfamily)